MERDGIKQMQKITETQMKAQNNEDGKKREHDCQGGDSTQTQTCHVQNLESSPHFAADIT